MATRQSHFAGTANPSAPHPDPRVAEALRAMNEFEYQDENGVDLTLIEWMLRLSPEQRIRQGDAGAREHQRIQRSAQRVR